MARASTVVVLTLVMFALIGMACAADSAATPDNSSDDDYVLDGDDDYSIGSFSADADSPNSVVPGPLGGPVPPGAFDHAQGSPSSAVSSDLHRFSAVAGTASAALAGLFYF
ncbi:hypothetical protein CR513_28782, partial [Mucuna pruriens]